MSSTPRDQDRKSSSKSSMSSSSAASIMSEKERAYASWQEIPDKKPSKLSKVVTFIKNIEPPEPVIGDRHLSKWC